MTEKRFIERYAGRRLIGIEDIETNRVCVTIEENIRLLNELSDENKQLRKENQGFQDKVMRLLDYVESKQCVTRTEIKKWWNGDAE